jgi:hypothetical protein
VSGFLAELKRRNVIRMAGLYLVVKVGSETGVRVIFRAVRRQP